MLLLFGLLFQLIPPGKYQSTTSKKIIKIYYDEDSYCKPHSGEFGSYKDNDNNAHYYCDQNIDQFVFKNCYFHDIIMNAGRYSYLILTFNCDLTIEDSIFKENQVYARLISAEQDNDNDYNFVFKSNQINHLKFYEKQWFETTLLTGHRHCVYSAFKNSIITDNRIELDDSLGYKARGTGFHLKYHSGCIFKGNTLKNCVNEDEAGGLYFDEKGSKGTLQFSDCTFTNCKGEDPSIMYIKDMDSQLTITGVTFEQSENTDKHCLIKVTPNNDNDCDLIFESCNFINLKCNGISCGSIGLWFVKEGSESSQILEFKGSTFRNLIYSHDSFGGGAISLTKEERNKKTQLIVDGCTFDNVYSENGYGGAIYYDPDDNDDFCSLKVTNCTFQQTYSNNKDVYGQAIFIGNTKSRDNFIKFCTFNDCCNELTGKYAIYIDAKYIEFSNNIVTFSDTSRNNGCVYSSRVEEHVYKNNIFSNARADGDLSAGIHERNPTSTSKFTVINNTFDNILGSSQGRCFMIDLKKTYEQNIQNNTIKNCPSGGALFQIRFVDVDDQSFTIESFNFIGNSVSDALYNTYQSAPQVLVLEYSDSAQFYDRNLLVFSNCYFENNYNPYTGGAISYGNSRFTAYTTVRFYRCNFVENHAKNGGGAISVQLYDGCMIEECNFVNNIADEGSSAIYIQTVFKCKNNGNDIEMPSDVNPNVQILKCTFNGNNEGKSSCILIDSSSNAPISINETSFLNAKVPNYVIEIQSDVKSFVSFGNTIEFTDLNGCGGIYINSKGKTTISNTKFIQTSKNSALTITSSSDSDSVSVKNCLFDSCLANGYSCFSLSIKTNSLSFENNIIQKIAAKGCSNYIGLFDGNGKLQVLTIKSVSFLDNVQSSLYGGGSGLMFNNIAELVFEKCNFTNNCAVEDRSERRQSQYSEHPYYNGDGGAIQIGHLCQTNNMKVTFSHCEFNGNKAQRNGGAIAIQTLNEVLMEYCKFNNNIANYDFSSMSSSTLLFDDHFYKKQDGRGGAIYINPSYNHNCQTTNDYMTKVELDNNDFNLNNAFDGYAIYIEGDDGTNTIFNIQDNSFNDNFNESNYNKENPDAIYGAVIVTEIFTITEKSLNDNYNHFEYKLTTKKVNMLSHVDHYAHTPTNEFTASDFFPSNNFTYSNVFTQSHLFSNSNPFDSSDFFTKSVQFSQSNLFSKSTQFSQSNFFSKSTEFDPSNIFSESAEFEPSNLFTKSAPFGETSLFSSSEKFSHSKPFSSSQKFTSSDVFSQSNTLKIKIPSINTEENKVTDTPTVEITEEKKITETQSVEITEEKKITETQSVENTEDKIIENTQTVINPSKQVTTVGNVQNPTENIHSSFSSTTQLNKDDGTGSSNSNKSSKNIKVSLIIGIVIGVIVLIVIVLIVIIFVIHKKREHKTDDINADEEMATEAAISTNSAIDEFNNPLYQNAQINGDPFDQVFDEDDIV